MFLSKSSFYYSRICIFFQKVYILKTFTNQNQNNFLKLLASKSTSWYNKGGRTIIEIFTYQNYLAYKKYLNRQKKIESINYEKLEEIEDANNELHENSEEYSVEDSTVNNEHDKIFRRILDNKKEAIKLINKSLNLKVPITEEQIEKYNSSFVTEKLKNQECDIIYKKKEQNIFFLIEHQTKIDYNMPLRILKYEYEIIESAIDKNHTGKKDYKFPTVIPIVLYSGRKKWQVKDYISKVQEQLEGYQNIEFAKYNIVDVNNYTEEELLKEKSFLSKVMLIEKTRYTSNIVKYLEKIVEEINSKGSIYTKEHKELLITIIELVLKRKIDENEANKLIKNLKGESKTMLAVLEMIDEENKRIFAQGEKRGKKIGKLETAKKLLERGIAMEIIVDATGLKQEEIMKKAKKEI